jgi:hypothetical protein
MKKTISLGAALCALAASASAQISFNPAVAYGAGNSPDATAVGDFNGDGRLDLATASDAPDKVTILTNNGGGVFAAAGTVLTGGGTSPHTPIAGDLDGDGDIDIAVSLKNTNQVRILVNNAGTFSLGPVFSVGLEPRDMAIADIDNDGDLDLAVSNRDGNTVSVLRNMGGLNFNVSSVQAGVEPRSIAFGDVSGDGLADLVIASHDSAQVLVLANIGGGAFAPLSTIALGALKPEGIALARLNGDALLDIAASTSNNGVEFVSVSLNQGGGAFAGATHFPTGGADSSFLVAADLDLDGDIDLATANTDSNNVSLLAGNGAGSFGAAQLRSVGSEPGHILAADLDGNGSPDLVTTDSSSNAVSVLLNQASGSVCGVQTYCQAKQTSIGTFPSVGSSGTPSVSAQDFVITVSNAMPNANGLAFFSNAGAANLPFQGGTLCLATPISRLPAQSFSAQGSAGYPIAVTPAMVGTTRRFQFWFRDNGASFGSGLSNAAAVTFCN